MPNSQSAHKGLFKKLYNAGNVDEKEQFETLKVVAYDVFLHADKIKEAAGDDD